MNEDKIIFDKLISKNPNKGVKYLDYKEIKLKKNGHKKIYYKIYSWFSGKEDYFIIGNRLSPHLKKNYGITLQVYYDIIILGIESIDQRPKCNICNKDVPFRGLWAGYRKTCNDRSCEIQYDRLLVIESKKRKVFHHTEKSKELLRQKALGRKHSEESKQKMSESRKGVKKTFSKEFISYLINRNKAMVWTPEQRERISIASTNRLLNSNRKGIRSKYFSDKFNEQFLFDSSWEERFIKLMEKTYICRDISILKRCRDIVQYKKDDGTLHRYLPDFYIEFKDGIKVVIEIKPASLVKNDRVVYLKKIAAKKYFKNKGIKYIILTENELFKRIKGSFNIYDFIV